MAVSGAPPVAGLSVETLRSVKPKRAVKMPTLPVAFAQRSIVGGTSETAVAGAVVRVGDQARIDVERERRVEGEVDAEAAALHSTSGRTRTSSGWETDAPAWIGIVIEVAVAADRRGAGRDRAGARAELDLERPAVVVEGVDVEREVGHARERAEIRRREVLVEQVAEVERVRVAGREIGQRQALARSP